VRGFALTLLFASLGYVVFAASVYWLVPVTGGLSAAEYVVSGAIIIDFLRNVLITSGSFMAGTYLSQVYEIGILHEHRELDMGRIKRAGIYQGIFGNFLWSVCWYGILLPWLLPLCVAAWPAVPLVVLKSCLDQLFWTPLLLWWSYFIGRWYIEGNSASASLKTLLSGSIAAIGSAISSIPACWR